MGSFLASLKWLVPSWLNTGVTQSQASLIDEYGARARAGLEARLPSRAGADANALTGQDRGLIRGRTEADSHYAARLIAWRYPRGHRVRGSAFALLNQVANYFGGVRSWSIDQKGNRHVHEVDGTESFSYGYTWNWTPGGPLGQFWLVLELVGVASAGPLIGASTGLWGGVIGAGPGKAIGTSGIDVQDVAAIQNLLNGPIPWRPAGTQGQWAIVSFTSPAAPAPASNWDQYGNRDPAFRYWRLLP